jgi:hypothetical protein
MSMRKTAALGGILVVLAFALAGCGGSSGGGGTTTGPTATHTDTTEG